TLFPYTTLFRSSCHNIRDTGAIRNDTLNISIAETSHLERHTAISRNDRILPLGQLQHGSNRSSARRRRRVTPPSRQRPQAIRERRGTISDHRCPLRHTLPRRPTPGTRSPSLNNKILLASINSLSRRRIRLRTANAKRLGSNPRLGLEQLSPHPHLVSVRLHIDLRELANLDTVSSPKVPIRDRKQPHNQKIP